MKKEVINLKKSLALVALVFFTFGKAQMTIEGTVTSAEGYPELEAMVKVDGAKPVFTDENGRFQLKVLPSQVSNGRVTLVAESINGASQAKTIRYKAGSVLKNDFKLEAITLDEVVAIGYGTARKKDLSGAIVSLKPKQDEAATANSLEDLLKGQASGISISSPGSTPGAASSIIIRGANSLTGDSQPLYVIDNVPQPSAGQAMSSASGDFQLAQDPLAGINFNDIEDIQILKDASATAIYGSRGANGVILITTKRGKKGDAKITFSTNTTITQAMNLPSRMNLEQYANFDELRTGEDKYDIANGKVIYKYKGKDENNIDVDKEKEITYRDWLSEALRTAYSSTYNLNINGGAEKILYNVSLGYKDVNGIVKNTGFKHGDVRLNLTANLTDKLKINLIASGYMRRNNMMTGGNTVGRTSGSMISTAMNSAPYITPSDDSRINDDSRVTVFNWITDYDDITNDKRFSFSGDVNYRITPTLSYTLRTGGALNNVERLNWYGLGLFKGEQENGVLTKSLLSNSNYNIENLLNYNRNFKHLNVSAVAGVTYDAYMWDNTGLYANNFAYHNLRTNGLSIASSIRATPPLQKDYQLLSYLGRLNLSFFDGKYILTGTFRGDATSKFSKENRWAYFPSFALAWNIKQENFLKDTRFLNQLKLRGGYGVTGSQNIDPYVTLSKYTNGLGYATPSGDILKGLLVSLSNNALKWETTKSYNLGLDFGFLSNRISGTVELYDKNTSDLLVSVTVPGSTSYSTITSNNGEISNKGVETALNFDLFRKQDFNWSIGGNITFNRPLIKKLGVSPGNFATLGNNVRAMLGTTIGDQFGAPNIFIEGYAPGLFFGYKTDGIVQEAEVADYASKLNTPFTKNLNGAAGNLKYVDENGDGKIDSRDRTIIGDPNPDFVYGFNTSLRYKRFRFSAQFTGVKGGDIMNADMRYRYMAGFNSGGQPVAEAVFNAWTPDNSTSNYPAIAKGVNFVNGIIVDRYIQDGSYLRCSDITLGFTLPQKLSEQLKMSNFDFYFSVKNAFTLTNGYKGFDVTSRSFNIDPLRRGIELYSYPMQRSYVIGANISF